MENEEAIYWVGVFTLADAVDWREALDAERWNTQQAQQQCRFLVLAFKDIQDNAMPPVLYNSPMGQRIMGIVRGALDGYWRWRQEAA